MVRIAKEMASDVAKGFVQALFALAMLVLPGVAVCVGVWFLIILFFGG